MSLVELKISESVLSGQEVIESYVIPNKIKVSILAYKSSCPDSSLATSRLEFGSDVLWVIQRDSSMSSVIHLIGDGVKSINLICDNACADDYYFNAYVKIGVYSE